LKAINSKVAAVIVTTEAMMIKDGPGFIVSLEVTLQTKRTSVG
jgi:hypothetical protein